MHRTSNNTLALFFKMLSVALSGLVFICQFSWRGIILLFPAYLPAWFYKINLKFLKYHIYFHLHETSSQEMMRQIYDLETTEPQDIPIEVCVMFYKALLDYLHWGCEEVKARFLAIVQFTQMCSGSLNNSGGAI